MWLHCKQYPSCMNKHKLFTMFTVAPLPLTIQNSTGHNHTIHLYVTVRQNTGRSALRLIHLSNDNHSFTLHYIHQVELVFWYFILEDFIWM